MTTEEILNLVDQRKREALIVFFAANAALLLIVGLVRRDWGTFGMCLLVVSSCNAYTRASVLSVQRTLIEAFDPDKL